MRTISHTWVAVASCIDQDIEKWSCCNANVYWNINTKRTESKTNSNGRISYINLLVNYLTF